MPELVDRLTRFFEHDTDEESGIRWSVSGGGLEGSKRHYRIFYCIGEDKYSTETTIDIEDDDWKVDLVEFLTLYRAWKVETTPEFREAVARLIHIDLWLSIIQSK
jgi:hypothetical protein